MNLKTFYLSDLDILMLRSICLIRFVSIHKCLDPESLLNGLMNDQAPWILK